MKQFSLKWTFENDTNSQKTGIFGYTSLNREKSNCKKQLLQIREKTWICPKPGAVDAKHMQKLAK